MKKQRFLDWLLSLGIAALVVGIATTFLVKDVPRDLLYIQVAVGIAGALLGLFLALRRKASVSAVVMLISGTAFALVGMFSFFVSYGAATAFVGVAALMAYWLLKRQA